jgi:hypothetical protein
VCLSGFELPPRLRQGFFVPFVVALQRQADPESDLERPSAALEGRTILLNARGLEWVRQVSPPGKRQQQEPAPVLPPAATCRIAQELAAVQLNHPQHRRERFARIHTRLAEWIITEASQFPRGYGSLPPFPDLLGWALGISDLNRGHWMNARLAESPHWQVLQRYAPSVATALKNIRGLKEADLSQTWGQIDGWFGVAAQERDEVIEAQQKQAQVEALRLLAAAGFDPRACADVFLSASAASPDAAVLEAYEQARRKALDPRSGLPSRFLPAEQKVMIYPRSARPGNGSSGAEPEGSNR